MSSPLSPPPIGGDQDRGGRVIAIYWVMAVVGVMIVSLRFYARLSVRSRTLGADDWMMAVAVVLQVILTCFCTYEATIGGFRHLYYLTPVEIQEAIKWNYILQCFGIFAFIPPKLSVCLLLVRILNPLRGWRFYVICCLGVFLTISNILDSIFTYVQCMPPESLWRHDIHGKCWNPAVQKNFSVFQGSVNIFADTVLALLPVTIIYNLSMPVAKRLALCTLLGMGLFAAISGAIKTSYLASLTARSDITWETYNLVVWSGAENFVVLVCGSVPPLKSLWDIHIMKQKVYTGGSSRYTEDGRPLNKVSKSSAVPVTSTVDSRSASATNVDAQPNGYHV